MNNPANQIIKALNTLFAQMDSEVLASSQRWAMERQAAIREFKKSDEYQTIKRDAYKLYMKLHTIAGGKTWYAIFNETSPESLTKYMEKNCAAVVEKRNAMIAAKLDKAGVTEILSEEYTNTKDGFDGVYIVKTDAGNKRIKISTIYAGGYNIQCLHLRVLVTVK